jgi:glucose-6-phosphate isomerase
MPFDQSIESARAERIGPDGVTAAAFDDALARAGEALDWLRARHTDGTLPLLRLPAARDDLPPIRDAARRLSTGATDVVILGTGGSSLGGQTLAQLAGHGVAGLGLLRDGPRLHFMDNLDGDSYGALLAKLPLATTRFVAISKSGGTAETLMQTIAALSAVKAAGLEARTPELFLGLSEPAKPGKRNGLRALLDAHRIAMLDHDTGVGGRFSVLTNVGLLPAAVLGLDIAAVRSGAATALAPVLERRPGAEVPAAVGAALSVALATTRHKSISVMLAYADKLERFTRWYVQLWAESLGKDGKGTTPVAALGPVDQHSQLQLFIAGPRDKLITVVTTSSAGRGPRMAADLAELCGEGDFAGKTMGDLAAAEGRATAETLAKNGCPVRTIHIDTLDEASLGELLMHFMLETIIAARLLGVDPFDQPAVEEGKVLAKRYLAGHG